MASRKKVTTEKSKVSKKDSKKNENLQLKIETLKKDNTIPASSVNPKYPAKKIMIFVLAVGVIALLAYLANKNLVVAWVDNKPVTKFDLYKALDKRYGKDVKEELIVDQLLMSEAKSRGVNVSNQDIVNEIKKIEEQQGGADKLNQILEVQGISREDLNNLVKLQLLRQGIFGKDINITDEDVEKYITDNKDQLPATIDDKLKQNIKEQLKQQQVNTNFNNWLTEVLKSSRVKRS